MNAYPCKRGKLPGTSDIELTKIARLYYHEEQKKAPRRHVYVKSAYFDGDKIFLDLFWEHLQQKRLIDRTRRLKLYACALELLQDSKYQPTTHREPDRPGKILHRFAGLTKEKQPFYVQVTESKRSGRKDFISVFPIDKFPQ